jgi:hypothetical protein
MKSGISLANSSTVDEFGELERHLAGMCNNPNIVGYQEAVFQKADNPGNKLHLFSPQVLLNKFPFYQEPILIAY